MKLRLLQAALLGAAVFLGSQSMARAQVLLYGLTSTNSLVILNSAGNTAANGPSLSGLGAGETAVSLDFRPLTGNLYVLTRDAVNLGRLYTVDVLTGAAAAVALSGPELLVPGAVDIDFNPAANAGVNALRIVTSEEHNYRLAFTPEGAAVNVDGAINTGGGAGGEGIHLTGTAYSNNLGGFPGGGGVGGTSQYAIDAATDMLYRVNPPNNGLLTEGKALGVDVAAGGGLDIVTGSNRAIALLAANGERGLFEIDLVTGQAARLRMAPDNVINIAAVAPVLLPSMTLVGLTMTNSLVLFTTEASGDDRSGVVAGPAIKGLGADEVMVSLDFRPLTGALYGLSRGADGAGRVYTIEVGSGQTKMVPLSGPELRLGEEASIDFNPAANGGQNALRILTSGGLNYRLVFAGEGATVNVDGMVNAPEGGGNAKVVATAYTNNRGGLPGGGGAGGTAQYALDAETDTLYRVNPPNNGTLIEGKRLPFPIDGMAGLDILTGSDRALALLQVGGGTGLFELDLARGSAGLVRALPGHIVDLAAPMPVLMTGAARKGADLELGWAGGMGPYAVQRAERVTDGFCTIAMASEPSAKMAMSGGMGFFRAVDLGNAGPISMTAALSGAAERPNPVNAPSAGGMGMLRLEGNVLSFEISYSGLSAAAAAAHIHGPADSTEAGDVFINLAPFNGGAFGAEGKIAGSVEVTPGQKAILLGGKAYVNIHTPANPGGEIRGQIMPSVFKADLSGAAQHPAAVSTEGFGFGFFKLAGNELTFHAVYGELSGPAVAAHLHGPAPGGANADVLIDLAPFNGGAFSTFGTLAGKISLTSEQAGALADGKVYLNIHTAAHPGGEVRGQALPALPAAPFMAALTGAAERPDPVATDAAGFSRFELDGDRLTFRIAYYGLSAAASAAHLHGPATATGTAGVLIDLAPFHRGPFGKEGYFAGEVMLTPTQKAALRQGNVYVNVHTANNPGGEIRGNIAP